jgi:hypothetical protein
VRAAGDIVHVCGLGSLPGKRPAKLVGCRLASSLSPIEPGYSLDMPVLGSIFDLTVPLLEIFFAAV